MALRPSSSQELTPYLSSDFELSTWIRPQSKVRKQWLLPCAWLLKGTSSHRPSSASRRVRAPKAQPPGGWETAVKEPSPQQKASLGQVRSEVQVHFGAAVSSCWSGQQAATPARKSQGTVTSLRWSVLPQDAERLCAQELACSPSSSCQDRGVCRERNPVRRSGFSGRLQGSRHTISGTEVSSVKPALSAAHQPPQPCRPLLFSQAPPLSQSISSRKPSPMSQ